MVEVQWIFLTKMAIACPCGKGSEIIEPAGKVNCKLFDGQKVKCF